MIVSYKPEFFDYVSQLAKINKVIIMRRDGDKVKIEMSDADRQMSYCFNAPAEYFAIDGKIAFMDFNDFYEFYRFFDNPVIDVREGEIVVGDANSKITYIPANVALAEQKYKRPVIATIPPDYQLSIPADSVATIKSSIRLIRNSNPVAARFNTDLSSNTVTIKVFNLMANAESKVHSHTYDTRFAMNNVGGMVEDKSIEIFADFFNKIPSNKDYEITVAAGLVKLKMLTDDGVNLEIFTARRAGSK